MIKGFSEIPPKDGISYTLGVVQRGIQIHVASEAESEIVEVLVLKIVGLVKRELSILGTLAHSALEGSLLSVSEIGEFLGDAFPVTVQLHEALHLLNHLSI